MLTLAAKEDHKGADPSALPLLLCLPGVDGSYATAGSLAPKLAPAFDVKALVIPKDCREDLLGLVQVVRVWWVLLQRPKWNSGTSSSLRDVV